MMRAYAVGTLDESEQQVREQLSLAAQHRRIRTPTQSLPTFESCATSS